MIKLLTKCSNIALPNIKYLMTSFSLTLGAQTENESQQKAVELETVRAKIIECRIKYSSCTYRVGSTLYGGSIYGGSI